MKIREYLGGPAWPGDESSWRAAWWAKIDEAMLAAGLPNVEIDECYTHKAGQVVAAAPLPPGPGVAAIESCDLLVVRFNGQWHWFHSEMLGYQGKGRFSGGTTYIGPAPTAPRWLLVRQAQVWARC